MAHQEKRISGLEKALCAMLEAFETLKTANGGEDFTGWHDSFHPAIAKIRAAIKAAEAIL